MWEVMILDNYEVIYDVDVNLSEMKAAVFMPDTSGKCLSG